MEIKINKSIIDFLSEKKINIHDLKEGDNIFFLNEHIKMEEYSNFNHKCLYENGSFSYAFSPLGLGYEISVGRYCSIAGGVKEMGPGHPISFVTTHPIITDDHYINLASTFNKRWNTIDFKKSYGKIIIGNDVWIGSEVLIKGGCTIGDGAIVASGSAVTKDVPPYAIVGGNPAKIIRMRFNEKIVEKFLEIKWWRFAYWDLNILDWKNPDIFIEEFYDLRPELKEFSPQKISVQDLVRLQFAP